ncbi:SubName: Full=Uncharacterized protein {ECO:0000313/EMBL:KIM25418.1} [Serendipita indica DSM 11827]|nr:SubName: Full=Uncharacterized protein {ECO:0000313/EMBL:KIM25418.1} [Serendipita indica DSM 11827]
MAKARNIPAPVAEARFQLISVAYDRLRDPSGSRTGVTASQRDDEYRREVARRRAAAAAAARYQGFGVRDGGQQPMTMSVEPDKLWQRDEGLLFVFGVMVCFAVAYHVATPTPARLVREQHDRSQRHLSDARARGKEHGMQRREEIKAWLREREQRQSSGLGSAVTLDEEVDGAPTSHKGYLTRQTRVTGEEDLEGSLTPEENSPDIPGFGDAVST